MGTDNINIISYTDDVRLVADSDNLQRLLYRSTKLGKELNAGQITMQETKCMTASHIRSMLFVFNRPVE